ncbi:hypothetical protein D9M73_291490 [compost metagenome]
MVDQLTPLGFRRGDWVANKPKPRAIEQQKGTSALFSKQFTEATELSAAQWNIEKSHDSGSKLTGS